MEDTPTLRKMLYPALLRKTADYPWKRHWAIMAPLLLILCATGIAHGFWGDQPQAWYAALRAGNPDVTRIMRGISKYSTLSLYACYAAILAYAFARKDTEKILLVVRFILIAIITNAILTHLLKAGLGMPRPGYALPARPFSFLNAYSSFPSGHTVAVITAALPLALCIGKTRTYAFLALLIAAVGFSRVWLGEHHPVDILGGIALGSLAARYIFLDAAGKLNRIT